MSKSFREIKRGDVYFADLGNPFGAELGHRRYVLVLQAEETIEESSTVVVAVIVNGSVGRTDKVVVKFHIEERNQEMNILLDHIRTIDKNRLGDPVGHLEGKEMDDVNAALFFILGLDSEE